MTEAYWSDVATSQGMLGAAGMLGRGRKKQSLQRERGPASTLILDLWSPD